MRLYKVADIGSGCLKEGLYDLAIFASGVEQRCTLIPELLKREHVIESVVFGYEESKEDYYRPDNDKYFRSEWADDITIASDSNDTVIYDRLRRVDLDGKERFRILVDYSTMSRLWYGSILNWLRYFDGESEVEIDFLYSLGVYKNEFSPLVIEDILAIPGYEGSPIVDARSLAIFGLGFDGIATLGAFDLIEPNIVYAYLASPGAAEGYAEQTEKYNNLFLSGYVENLLKVPILSIEATLKSLTELISPHRGETNIIIVPMGPKPHVLAAMLLCLRFEKEVTCLRVRGRREPRVDVEATGSVVATRVFFKPEQASQVQEANRYRVEGERISAHAFDLPQYAKKNDYSS